jgi:hypothetical protein
VLANATGYTLYWFAPDTPVTSGCCGSCAVYSYICGSTPGLARSNNLNLHGGPWHEARVSR